MITSFFFLFRLTLAWMLLFLLVSLNLSEFFFRHIELDFGGLIALMAFALAAAVLVTAFSHLRRVRLITGHVTAAALSNRQRRQIEIPFEAGESFDLIDALSLIHI